MRRMVFVLGVVLAAAMVFAGGVGTAVAEPGKNRITSTTDPCSNDETYTFTINAMGKVGQLEGTTSNLQIKSYTLKYFDPASGEQVAEITYGGGKKTGQQGDLITCEGETTTEIFRFGLVRIEFELEAFVTPRGR